MADEEDPEDDPEPVTLEDADDANDTGIPAATQSPRISKSLSAGSEVEKSDRSRSSTKSGLKSDSAVASSNGIVSEEIIEPLEEKSTKSQEELSKIEDIGLDKKKASLNELSKDRFHKSKKMHRQCPRRFKEIIGKRELRNEELEKQTGDLKQRLNILECSMPAVMVWNIWRMAQGACVPSLKRTLEKQFQGPASGEVYCPSTPSRHFDCRVREVEAERKQALKRAEEARSLWAEKVAALEDKAKRLEEVKRIQEETKEKIQQLTAEASKLKAAASKDAEDGACETGECGVIECKKKWLDKVPSNASIKTTDIECLQKLQELAEKELAMKRQMADMERREEAYMRTLQQADELWSKLEGDAASTVSVLQEQLDLKTTTNQKMADRICELEDVIEQLVARLSNCRGELEKYVSITRIEALIGRDDDFANILDKGVSAFAEQEERMVGTDGYVGGVRHKGLLSKGDMAEKDVMASAEMDDAQIGIHPDDFDYEERRQSALRRLKESGDERPREATDYLSQPGSSDTLDHEKQRLKESGDEQPIKATDYLSQPGSSDNLDYGARRQSALRKLEESGDERLIQAADYLAQLGSLSELDKYGDDFVCDITCNDQVLTESGLTEEEIKALEENHVSTRMLMEKTGMNVEEELAKVRAILGTELIEEEVDEEVEERVEVTVRTVTERVTEAVKTKVVEDEEETIRPKEVEAVKEIEVAEEVVAERVSFAKEDTVSKEAAEEVAPIQEVVATEEIAVPKEAAEEMAPAKEVAVLEEAAEEVAPDIVATPVEKVAVLPEAAPIEEVAVPEEAAEEMAPAMVATPVEEVEVPEEAVEEMALAMLATPVEEAAEEVEPAVIVIPVEEVAVPVEAAEEVAVPIEAADEIAVHKEAAEEVTVPIEAADKVAVPKEGAEEVAGPIEAAEEVAVPIEAAEEVAVPIEAAEEAAEEVAVPIEAVDEVTVPIEAVDEVTVPIEAVDQVAVPKKAAEEVAEEVAVPIEAAEDVAVPTKAAEEVAVPIEAAEDVAVPKKAAEEVAVSKKAAEKVAAPKEAAEKVVVPEAVLPAKEVVVAEEVLPAKEVVVAEEVLPAKEVVVAEEVLPAKEVVVAEEVLPAKEVVVAEEALPVKEVVVAEEVLPAKEVVVAEEVAPAIEITEKAMPDEMLELPEEADLAVPDEITVVAEEPEVPRKAVVTEITDVATESGAVVADEKNILVPRDQMFSWKDDVDLIRSTISQCSNCVIVKKDADDLARQLAIFTEVEVKEIREKPKPTGEASAKAEEVVPVEVQPADADVTEIPSEVAETVPAEEPPTTPPVAEEVKEVGEVDVTEIEATEEAPADEEIELQVQQIEETGKEAIDIEDLEKGAEEADVATGEYLMTPEDQATEEKTIEGEILTVEVEEEGALDEEGVLEEEVVPIDVELIPEEVEPEKVEVKPIDREETSEPSSIKESEKSSLEEEPIIIPCTCQPPDLPVPVLVQKEPLKRIEITQTEITQTEITRIETSQVITQTAEDIGTQTLPVPTVLRQIQSPKIITTTRTLHADSQMLNKIMQSRRLHPEQMVSTSMTESSQRLMTSSFQMRTIETPPRNIRRPDEGPRPGPEQEIRSINYGKKSGEVKEGKCDCCQCGNTVPNTSQATNTKVEPQESAALFKFISTLPSLKKPHGLSVDQAAQYEVVCSDCKINKLEETLKSHEASRKLSKKSTRDQEICACDSSLVKCQTSQRMKQRSDQSCMAKIPKATKSERIPKKTLDKDINQQADQCPCTANIETGIPGLVKKVRCACAELD